jgi:hypothetical protein
VKPDVIRWLRRLENPQFQKRVREYVRGRRAFWVIGIYTAVLAVICFYILAVEAGGGREPSVVGRDIFGVLGGTQAILISILCLALAQWSMVTERATHSFPLLVLTGMSPRRILAGEIMANLAFAGGLIIVGMPMMGLTFLLGGASLGEIVAVAILCLAAALVVSSLGLLGSVISQGGNLVTLLLKGIFATGAIGFSIVMYIVWLTASQADATRGGTPWPIEFDSPFSFYGTNLPGVICATLLVGLLVFAMLSVACRKFTDSSRRAFDPRLFALVAGILLIIIAGASYSGRRVRDDITYTFNIVACGVILAGILFSAGRDREEELCPRHQGQIEKFILRGRLHLIALIIIILFINHVWRRTGSFDLHAEERLLFYYAGILLAGQGIVNFLDGLIPNRRALIYSVLPVFILVSTVIPFAGILIGETYGRVSPVLGVISGNLFAASPGVGVIGAIEPAEFEGALRLAGPAERWLWISVALVHGVIFLLGTIAGGIMKRSRRQASPSTPASSQAAANV